MLLTQHYLPSTHFDTTTPTTATATSPDYTYHEEYRPQGLQEGQPSRQRRRQQHQHIELPQERQFAVPSTTATARLATAATAGTDLNLNLGWSNFSPSPPEHLLSHPSPVQPSLSPPDGDSSMLNAGDFLPTDTTWFGSGHLTPRTSGRFAHYRESSMSSSLGSAGPASPFSQNTSNPQIAVTDSLGDGFSALPLQDDLNYHLAKALPASSNEGFYTNYSHHYAPDSATSPAYANMMGNHRPKTDRGLLPHRDLSIGQNRSRPVSVASSIASDSPLTPATGEPDHELLRRRTALNNLPKLDRTMTDIYNDELYNPNFTITVPPSQASQAIVSPNNDVFARRLQAANSQHLSAAQSPVSTTSRDISPFRNGSPLAPAPSHSFGANMEAPSRLHYGSSQQGREQRQEPQVFREHITRSSDPATPQTISPKDAVLEFHEPEGEANNFPLFPPHDAPALNMDQVGKVVGAQAGQSYDNMPLGGMSFNFGATQMPGSLQIPQHYPFVARTPQQGHGHLTTLSSASMSMPSRDASSEASPSDSHSSASPQRPLGTSADGGTYTCTYHGCTLRFETPALLQKHKREGHRQAHGLAGPRRTDTAAAGMPPGPGLLNTQAGPHRCDRINPSTGKPCSTVFSRPYDLTRHEDTIHNARKQKVRCNLCTEEKTFSRADALTRHYRVCHPEVEFQGKHRRRANASA